MHSVVKIPLFFSSHILKFLLCVHWLLPLTRPWILTNLERLCLIGLLVVLFPFPSCPKGRPGLSDIYIYIYLSLLSGNRISRAVKSVIWFPFLSPLVFMPSLLAVSALSFFCCLFSQFFIFSRFCCNLFFIFYYELLFFNGFCWDYTSWYVLCGSGNTGNCHYAFMSSSF